jgi:hypothetical protein
MVTASFTAFAGRLVGACGPRAPNADALIAEIARRSEETALHFTHPGPARDDALAVFWQVVPLALDRLSELEGEPDPERWMQAMIASIHASPQARDFNETALAEPCFRALALPALRLIRDRAQDRPR